ncbi:MAG: DUF3850 domain-containing protein [Candidatus Gracilibacteria bacterium]
MSKIVKKYILPQYFEQVLAGTKNYELRLGDIDANVGDTLHLVERMADGTETGRSTDRLIKSRVNTKDILFWSQEEIEKNGYSVLGF